MKLRHPSGRYFGGFYNRKPLYVRGGLAVDVGDRLAAEAQASLINHPRPQPNAPRERFSGLPNKRKKNA